jgi:sRNA-binding carbon storage regulator CsrA
MPVLPFSFVHRLRAQRRVNRMAIEGGLTLTRREGQSFVMSARNGQALVDGQIEVQVVEVRPGGSVKLKILAPPDVLILRSELKQAEESPPG